LVVPPTNDSVSAGATSTKSPAVNNAARTSGEWPKIALVTPVFNSARYLEATIRSVLSQGYPNLQYVIADGGSTDGSVEIIRKYEPQLHAWFSEPDRGMYDAINKGFARTSDAATGEATGEAMRDGMGWISATDLLHAGSLFVVGSVLRTFPELEWITGRPTGFSDEGMVVETLRLRQWSRWRFLAGANRYIQQESTFWRRSLWDRAGGRVDDARRSASDFELWVRFFRFAKLYPVDALIGGFRSHPDSLGLRNLEECHAIHEEILAQEVAGLPDAFLLRGFRSLSASVLKIPALAKPWRKLVLGTLMKWPGKDLPPVIRYRDGRWVMS
jgi:glycosyltransferase involved in cell wall biosynthesis